MFIEKLYLHAPFFQTGDIFFLSSFQVSLKSILHAPQLLSWDNSEIHLTIFPLQVCDDFSERPEIQKSIFQTSKKMMKTKCFTNR